MNVSQSAKYRYQFLLVVENVRRNVCILSFTLALVAFEALIMATILPLTCCV